MEIYDGGTCHYPQREPVYKIGGERLNLDEFQREVVRRWPRASEVTVVNVTGITDDCDVFDLVYVE